MEIFKNKFLVKLIATICLVFTLLNFSSTNRVYADDGESWGGVLIKPVVHLFTGLGDGVMEILHRYINEQDATFIKLEKETNWWAKNASKILGVILGIVLVGAAIAATIATAGALGVTITLAAGKTVALVSALVLSGGVAGYFVADYHDGSDFPNNTYLPVFTVSLDNIFKDDVALLDINFFSKNKVYHQEIKVEGESKTIYSYDENRKPIVYTIPEVPNGQNLTSADEIFTKYTGLKDLINKAYKTGLISDGKKIKQGSGFYFTIIKEVKYENLGPNKSYTNHIINIYKESKDGEKEYLYRIEYSAQSNSITVIMADNKENIVVESTAQKLRDVISTWYFILRNLALLILMIVLIYVGIRIVTGSTAGEKAKYKERLMDWIVALCLTFIMHYIMVFSVNIVEEISKLVENVGGENLRFSNIMLTEDQLTTINDEYPDLMEYVDLETYKNEGVTLLCWETDLMGAVKISSQLEKEGTAKWVGMAIAYVVLVFYTIFFIWTYLKRVLYMAFLTIMSPLVAMTYPIDKINDGKAQAFNMWFREYIFNLLIQPMHLLLYTVLISSAFQLASENIIYTLVAVGFMIPAEKLVRKFFGFEKAQTPGLLSGAAGAALAMTGLQRLMNLHPKKKGKSDEEGKGEKDSNKDIKFSSKEGGADPYNTLFGSDEGESQPRTRHANPQPQDTSGGVDNDAASRQAEEANQRRAGASAAVAGSGNVPSAVQAGAARVQAEETNTPKAKNKKKSGIVKKSLRTIKGASSAYARGMKKKILKRIEKGKPVRALARGAAGLLAGGTLGLTGLALGIASGDSSKALQYTSAGALGGYGAGKGLANSVADTLSVDSDYMNKETELAWYGDEYGKHKYEENFEKNFLSDKNIDYMRRTFGCSREEAKEFLSDAGRRYYDSGVSNIEDVATIRKAVEEGMINDEAEAIAASRLKSKLPQDIKTMSSKKLGEYVDTYTNIYADLAAKQHPDWDENTVNNFARSKAAQTINDIRKLEAANDMLTEV